MARPALVGTGAATDRGKGTSMKWRGPVPLRRLLIGQFLLVVLSAALVVGLLVKHWRLPAVQAQNEVEQHRTTTLALQQMETSLDNAEQLAATLAHLLPESPLRPAINRDMLGMVLVELARRDQGYEGMYLLDAQHRVLALGLADASAAQLAEWRGGDFSGLPVLHLPQAPHQPQWSDQYQSLAQRRPVVGLVWPAQSGVLLLELSAARLAQSVVRSAGVDGMLVLVVDGRGEVLASSVSTPSQPRVNVLREPVIEAALRGGGRFDALTFERGVYAGTARRSQRLGWVVYVGYPEAVAEAARNAAIGITGITLVLAVLAGVVTLSVLASAIQRRVDNTVRYAQAVAAGHFEPAAQRSGITELEHLDDSLTQMAQAIQQRQMQLSALVEHAPNLAIQWFDRQGRVLDWNPAAHRLLGWSREEALGKTLGDLIYTPEQQQGFMAVLADIERTGLPFGPHEGEVRHRNGEVRVLMSTTCAIPDVGGGLQFVCTDVDITPLKENEARIRASEEKFNLLFHASPVAVGVMERVGHQFLYVDVNSAWETLMGYRRVDVVGSGISRIGIVADVQAHADLMAQLDHQAIVPRVETWVRRADGSQFLAEGSMGRLRMQGKDWVIYSLHDVTDKRRMEQDLRAFNAELENRIHQRTDSLTETNAALQQAVGRLQHTQVQLVQAEKLASLGEMVAGVAHELNTPIGNGLMAISTLSHRAKGLRGHMATGLRRSDLEHFVNQVETAGDIATRNLERASELISSFKQVAADQTSSQRRCFDVAELCHEITLTLQPMLKRTPFQVVVAVASGLQVDSYPGPLGQVLANLIQNAVTHGLSGREAGTIAIRGEAQGDEWVLSVEDDGAGIPLDVIGRVFAPFFTTRLGQGGSGLGLHIAHNVVTGVLGGQLTVSNLPGGGARFCLRCPSVAPNLSGAASGDVNAPVQPPAHGEGPMAAPRI